MTSWVTYARPFARRRAIYRKKAAQRQNHYLNYPAKDDAEIEYQRCRVEVPETCAEAVEWTWRDFVAAMSPTDGET